MSLKVKLILFIVVFAFLPIVVLEGYRNVSSYETELADAKNSLFESLRIRKDTFLRFFNGVCKDIEFIVKITEIEQLLTGFEDEDLDEIEYWTDALTTVLIAFANNRNVFDELYFSATANPDAIIAVKYADGQASEVENPSLPEEHKSISPDRPIAVWNLSGDDVRLWLHYPVQEGDITGVLSARIDLEQFYTLNTDREIYLTAPQGFNVISAGSAAIQSDSQDRIMQLPETDKSESSGIGTSTNHIFAFSKFAPIKWLPDERFILYKVRPKSVIIAPIRASFAKQSIGIFCILLLLIFLQIIFLNTLILKPLILISNVARRLADFDLTVNVPTEKKDEIGTLFSAIGEMVRSFKSVVGQVQQSGLQVASSATELSATVKEQEVIMATQVESTNRVVKSVEKISGVAINLVQIVQQVSAMAQGAAGYANSGQSDLLNMEEAMRHMEEASKSISGRLGTISEKADNITTVVTTINKVAEQTNLLSLNASIEAEKAGEYGRGFTVVAREIRRLADQTAVATLDIEQMVHEMQSAVSSGIMEMDKFIAEVRHSAEDVGKISMQLTLIIDQVQALSPNFEEVNTAMRQQSESAQKINRDMTNLSEEMQATKASLHETYSVISQLNEAASNLQDEVSLFKVE